MTTPVPSCTASTSEPQQQTGTPASRPQTAHPDGPRYALRPWKSGGLSATELVDHARDGGEGEPLIVASFFEHRDAEECLRALLQLQAMEELRRFALDAIGELEEIRMAIFRAEEVEGDVDNPAALAEMARLQKIIERGEVALNVRRGDTTPTEKRHADRMRRMAATVAAQVRKDPVRALASSPRPQPAAACNSMRTAMVSGHDGGGIAETVIDPRDASPFPASLSTVRRDSSECPVAVIGQGDQERAITPSQLLPNATSPQAHGRAAG